MAKAHEDIAILHVDDEPEFVKLAADLLAREEERFRVETATSAADGLELLAEQEFDCIISDYEMPGTNGIEFLKAVRERYPERPFILFTGKGSEEIASEAISAGVTNYMQKQSGTDQYTVLANRIRNATESYRRAQEAKRRRQRLEQILKTVPSCVVELDLTGQFVFANNRAEEILGLEPDEVSDRAYNDPEWKIRDLDGDPIPDEELPFRRVRDSEEPLFGYRHTIEWPDGKQRVLSVNGAPLFDTDGELLSVVFALRDISDQRE